MFVLTDLGALKFLNRYFKNILPANGLDLTLKLYTNNKVPADTDLISDYVIAAGGGYADKILPHDNWSGSIVNGIAQMSFAKQQFDFSGPLNAGAGIYGYVLVDSDNNLIGAEIAPALVTPQAAGNLYLVTPIIKMSHGIPA